MVSVIGFAQVEAIFTNTAWNSWIFGNIVKKTEIYRSIATIQPHFAKNGDTKKRFNVKVTVLASVTKRCYSGYN